MTAQRKKQDTRCRDWVRDVYRPWYEANATALSGGNSPPPPPPGDGE